MDGYTLQDKMRKLRRRFRFTATEQALFYELVAICNGENWGDVFEVANIELCCVLGINEKTLIKARESLINANLIYYKSGKSRKVVSSYSFKKPFKNASTTVTTTVNNTVVTPTDKGVDTPVDSTVDVTAFTPAYCTDLYKHKTKTKTSPPNACVHACEEIPEKNIMEKSLNDCYVVLLNDVPWMEQFAMNVHSSGYKDFTIENLKIYLEQFFMKLQNEGEYKKSPKDARSHFSRWLNIELEKQKQNGSRNNRSACTSKQEANEYAMQQYIADREKWEQCVPEEVSRPF